MLAYGVGVSAGGGVSVSGGGTGVFVSGGGIGVSVSGGGTGVLVSGGKGVNVLVGGGKGVFVGGTCVFVGGTCVIVDGGLGVEVEVVLGGRVLVGAGLVALELITGIVNVGEPVGVSDGIRIGVDSILMVDNACTVSAETVLILLTAKSTMLAGSRTKGVDWLGEERAIADVMHNRLIPRIPAATTPSRPV